MLTSYLFLFIYLFTYWHIYLSILLSISAFDKSSLQSCKVYGIDKIDKNFLVIVNELFTCHWPIASGVFYFLFFIISVLCFLSFLHRNIK